MKTDLYLKNVIIFLVVSYQESGYIFLISFI